MNTVESNCCGAPITIRYAAEPSDQRCWTCDKCGNVCEAWLTTNTEEDNDA